MKTSMALKPQIFIPANLNFPVYGSLTLLDNFLYPWACERDIGCSQTLFYLAQRQKNQFINARKNA